MRLSRRSHTTVMKGQDTMRRRDVQRRTTLALAAITLATLAVVVMADQPGRRAEGDEATGAVLDAAKAQLAVAERVCRMFHDPDSGAPRGNAGVEVTYLWSKRRMDAEINVARLDQEAAHGRIVAIERHLEWMRAWNKTVVESGAYSRFDIAATEYYIAEAETLLAQAKDR